MIQFLMVHFRKAGTAGLLPVGHHQGSGPSDAKFVRLSNPAGVMGGGGGSQYGDTGSVGGGDAAQRKNHSQIEKKRRDRMNTYIKVLYSRYLLAFSKFGSEKCVFLKLSSQARLCQLVMTVPFKKKKYIHSQLRRSAPPLLAPAPRRHY